MLSFPLQFTWTSKVLTYFDLVVPVCLKLTGDNSTVAFNFNSFPNVNDASNAILNLDYMSGGKSNVSGAFRTVTDVILTSGNGKRSGVPSICFLIVAYPPLADANLTATERDRLKAVCRLVILGVGGVSLTVFEGSNFYHVIFVLFLEVSYFS